MAERITDSRIDLSFVPIPDDPAGLSARFVLGGWIDDIAASDGYTFRAPDFPSDRIVGFGYPDEFITPLFIGDRPALSDTALKIGVGFIGLMRPGGYRFCEEPGVRQVLDWKIERTDASVRFIQEAAAGPVGYLLDKEIRLLGDRPGFTVSWGLTNRCVSRPIQTLWYWHPFVAPGGMGGRCFVKLPDTLVPAYDFVKPPVVDDRGRIRMPDDFSDLPIQLLEFVPADHGLVNRFEVGNVDHEKKLVVVGDFPLAFARLWYERRVFSVEPFYYLCVMPGQKRTWSITVIID
ncbi:MAG: hypothetical protein JW765_09585 [Deltaproteobacteria bacterium]|nr:hypothetical protein [Candidatus Zymogenaceae bacterium]